MHGDSAQGPHMRCSPFPLGRRQVSAPERSRSRSSVPASSCRNWAVPASLLVGSQRLQQFGLLDAMEAGRLALTAARPGSQRECTAKTSDYTDPKDGRRGCDDGVPVLENIVGELHLTKPWGCQESECEPLELLAAYGIAWGRCPGLCFLLMASIESVEVGETA